MAFDPIVDLSIPPLRAAGPNPDLAAFVSARRGRGRGPDEAYAGPLDPGGRHPVYQFHPYHTKVPPAVVRRLIEHYTQPGELVLDGFCGSGMTGVAARECGRHAVLCDLSPVATFVAGVNCTSHDAAALRRTMEEVLAASEAEWGHHYRTGDGAQVNYFVRSDVFTCPDCDHAFPFFPHGVEHHGAKVSTRKRFPCPGCGGELNVRRVRRVVEDGRKRSVLVWVNAGAGGERCRRAPDAHDLRVAEQASRTTPPAWFPTDPVDPSGYSARLAQLGDKGIRDASRFLSPRNLIVFADLWERVGGLGDPATRQACRAILTSVFTVISERQGYFGGGGGMSGNLYMPIVRMEKNVYATVRRKLGGLEGVEAAKAHATTEVLISTQSTTDLSAVPDASIDYIYTDPPFGANIIYSEMNLLLEAWLGVRTHPAQEAVIDPSRGRTRDDYARLLRACFAEYQRVLKPGRWLTVEFHSTNAAVWRAIQETIGSCGFEVVSVGCLDKGSTTILADIRPSAAKYDLLITARKPARRGKPFRLREGDADAVWALVSDRLRALPVTSAEKGGDGKLHPDRRRHRLFDFVVADHVARAVAVPLSAAAFNAGLRERFPSRDGVFFLPGQADATPTFDSVGNGA